MSYERKDFAARLAAKARDRQQRVLPAYRAVQAAAVVMAKLTTGSEEWNRYLSLVQGQINETRNVKEHAQTKLADPAIWDPQVLAKLKSDIVQADAMIAAYEFAMKLPKALVDGGAEATKLLAKLEKADAEDTSQAQS